MLWGNYGNCAHVLRDIDQQPVVEVIPLPQVGGKVGFAEPVCLQA